MNNRETWLSDVNVFEVNRLPAHSDHTYYQTVEEAENNAPMSMRHSLNGNWKFHYAINPDSRPKDFFSPDFDCRSWGNIQVPGHIQLQGYGKPQYVNTMYPWDGHHDILPPEIPTKVNPVGSYVKYFSLTDHMKDQPVYISFQGVETAFFVWLNGEFVGYSEDSFTPTEFDLTPYIKKDSENKLAVEVFQWSTGSWLEDQDFWRFSGIFRDVYLYTVPEIHVYDLHVQTDLNDTYTNGKLESKLTLQSYVPGSKVVTELFDKEGHVVTTSTEKLTGKTLEISMDVDLPKLWSAEDPYLYRVYYQVFNPAGELVEVVPQKVGFRKFEMVDKIMKINGERIVFKGVNRHEFSGRSGRTITKEDMLWDIKTLKRNNINAVRTAHYPNNSYWYDLCDEYGVYVIDEMNLETHGSWQKVHGITDPSWNIPGNKPEWNDIVMDRAKSMFQRDKNHPSILIWSCGNESFAGEVILNVSNYFRTVDPSRLVHYEGVFYAREYNDTSDMESQMYAKTADIEKYLQDDPEKPFIVCEYMHAMGNSLGGLYKYTNLERKYPMYQGGFIWDFMDQTLLKKDRYGQEYFAYGGDFGDRPSDYSFSANGIVFANRVEKPLMQEVKHLYQNIKIEPTQEEVIIRNENLFIDTSNYTVEIALFLEGKKLYSYEREINVSPQREKRVPYNWSKEVLQHSGEYSINVSLKLKEATLWEQAGYETAFGQYVFHINEKKNERGNIEDQKIRMVQSDYNIGVHGTDFSILFSKKEGTLTSINYDGEEMIQQPPFPLFWRASTDNDKGAQYPFHTGSWYWASLTRKCVETTVVEKEDSLSVTFTYQLPISEQVGVKVTYTVYPDGSIHVHTAYSGADGLPHMPIFAISFKIDADYDQLEWYALGPEENYSDRQHGARLGIYKNTVESNTTEYVVPQESGNRCGVRWVNITNEYKKGIKIASVDQPVECQISPYTAFELEQAAHHFELPKRHYTVVTVAGKQMGVGGDDSWGAPVHEEHRILAKEDREFTFVIQRL